MFFKVVGITHLGQTFSFYTKNLMKELECYRTSFPPIPTIPSTLLAFTRLLLKGKFSKYMLTFYWDYTVQL